jgi:hypothetical protein
MKRVSKQVAFFTRCGVMVTGFLGGISTSEASSLQLNNNVYQSQLYAGHELLQLDRHDDRRGHHRYRHHDDGDGGGGGDDLVTGVVIGAILGTVIANN